MVKNEGEIGLERSVIFFFLFSLPSLLAQSVCPASGRAEVYSERGIKGGYGSRKLVKIRESAASASGTKRAGEKEFAKRTGALCSCNIECVSLSAVLIQHVKNRFDSAATSLSLSLFPKRRSRDAMVH
jgi:hypothetical protein